MSPQNIKIYKDLMNGYMNKLSHGIRESFLEEFGTWERRQGWQWIFLIPHRSVTNCRQAVSHIHTQQLSRVDEKLPFPFRVSV